GFFVLVHLHLRVTQILAAFCDAPPRPDGRRQLEGARDHRGTEAEALLEKIGVPDILEQDGDREPDVRLLPAADPQRLAVLHERLVQEGLAHEDVAEKVVTAGPGGGVTDPHGAVHCHGGIEMGLAVAALLALADSQVVGGAEADFMFMAVQKDLAKPLLGTPLFAELDVHHGEVRLSLVLKPVVAGLASEVEGPGEIVESPAKITRADLRHASVVEPLVLVSNLCPGRCHQSPGLCCALKRRKSRASLRPRGSSLRKRVRHSSSLPSPTLAASWKNSPMFMPKMPRTRKS